MTLPLLRHGDRSRSCPQAASASEEAPVESAPEKPSDLGEDGVAEDPADAGARGGSAGKKESASSKAATDGKLVKGALGPAFRGPPALAGRGLGLPGGCPLQASATHPCRGAALTWARGLLADTRLRAACPHSGVGVPRRLQLRGLGLPGRSTCKLWSQEVCPHQAGLRVARFRCLSWSGEELAVSHTGRRDNSQCDKNSES